jgi:hypothetical protein
MTNENTSSVIRIDCTTDNRPKYSASANRGEVRAGVLRCGAIELANACRTVRRERDTCQPARGSSTPRPARRV